MKRTPAIALLALSLSATLVAGAAASPPPAVPSAAEGVGDPSYVPRSAFLRDPEEAKAFAVRSADFWVRHAFDREHGGTFADLLRDGTHARVVDRRRKTSNHQSRNAYAMTRAYMLTGDDVYLDHARSALDFLYTHSWDGVNGGWFAVHTPRGSVAAHDELNSRKDAFYQHYALLGIAAAVETEGRADDREWLHKGYGSLESGLWDSRERHEGYYDTADPDWENPRGKSFNATVDALTTHVLALHQLTGNPEYEQRAVDLAEQILTHLVGSPSRPRPGSLRAPGTEFGFAQQFESDWSVLRDDDEDDDDRVYVGHVLKSAWVLLRVNAIRPDNRYVEAARELIQEVWTYGAGTLHGAYDRQRGGVLSNYFWATGLLHRNEKLWWEQEQAFMAGLLHWYATGDEDSLRMADGSIDFFARHFEDPVFGEVYDTLEPDGDVIRPRKAALNKAGYHSAETGYLGYVYGNLLYHRRPVTLHYRFEPQPRVQHIRLTPLDIAADRLRIRGVTLDGRPFCSVNRPDRTLVVPPRVGGEFAVQFEVVDAADASPGDQGCRAGR